MFNPQPLSSLHGFRFSGTDAVVLAIAAGITCELLRRGIELWWIAPCVVGHFFLFCNVFRVRRAYELIWAGLFLLNTGFWMSRLSLVWQPPVLSQMPVTLAVLWAEIHSRSYHGILASRLNPHLHEYLMKRT